MSNAAIRAAVPEDAEALAMMINYAGAGIPMWLWSQAAEPGRSALDIGRERAAGTDGNFSYRNAWIIDIDRYPVAMLLGYQLEDPYDTGDLGTLPDVVCPLIELEAQAPGSWYVNAIAVMPQVRGSGLGGKLMGHAEQLAREAGSTAMSGIVAEQNRAAMTMCENRGYARRDTRPIRQLPSFPYQGDWVLMVKPLQA